MCSLSKHYIQNDQPHIRVRRLLSQATNTQRMIHHGMQTALRKFILSQG